MSYMCSFNRSVSNRQLLIIAVRNLKKKNKNVFSCATHSDTVETVVEYDNREYGKHQPHHICKQQINSSAS